MTSKSSFNLKLHLTIACKCALVVLAFGFFVMRPHMTIQATDLDKSFITVLAGKPPVIIVDPQVFGQRRLSGKALAAYIACKLLYSHMANHMSH
jgi:hypothetical protein